jgi:hypothetical protein
MSRDLVVAVAGLAALLTGCTAVNTAQVPTARGGRDPFITSGDLREPYESLGLLQVTRKGVIIFGVIDPAGTDLNAGFQEMLPRVREMGGDGLINVRWHQTQYTALARVFSILLLGLLPGEVTITGEVVRLRRGGEPGRSPSL